MNDAIGTNDVRLDNLGVVNHRGFVLEADRENSQVNTTALDDGYYFSNALFLDFLRLKLKAKLLIEP